jgi:hypothetical protein
VTLGCNGYKFLDFSDFRACMTCSRSVKEKRFVVDITEHWFL